MVQAQPKAAKVLGNKTTALPCDCGNETQHPWTVQWENVATFAVPVVSISAIFSFLLGGGDLSSP
eukprot:3918166-Rhodomonas_salina.1